MKILMIAPQPFFEPRGTPISVYQRIEGLSKLGHSVDLVTYHIGEDVEIPGLRIFRAPNFPSLIISKWGLPGLKCHWISSCRSKPLSYCCATVMM